MTCAPSSMPLQGRRLMEFFDTMKRKWDKELPSAVICSERSIDACLSFFNFPKDEWISLRTTNIIERLNKEFRRRTKSMEIVAGESACYRLLTFISLRMELHWRSNPLFTQYYHIDMTLGQKHWN